VPPVILFNRTTTSQPGLRDRPDQRWIRAKHLRGKLEPAEIFREVLEHRWFLSEAAGKDVGSLPAARSYVRDVLAHKPDELTVLDAPTGGMAVQHS